MAPDSSQNPSNQTQQVTTKPQSQQGAENVQKTARGRYTNINKPARGRSASVGRVSTQRGRSGSKAANRSSRQSSTAMSVQGDEKRDQPSVPYQSGEHVDSGGGEVTNVKN